MTRPNTAELPPVVDEKEGRLLTFAEVLACLDSTLPPRPLGPGNWQVLPVRRRRWGER